MKKQHCKHNHQTSSLQIAHDYSVFDFSTLINLVHSFFDDEVMSGRLSSLRLEKGVEQPSEVEVLFGSDFET